MDRLEEAKAALDKLKNVPLLSTDGKITILKSYLTDQRTVQVPNGWFKKPTPKTTEYISSLKFADNLTVVVNHDNQGGLYEKIVQLRQSRLRYLVMLKSFSELGYTLRPLQKITK